LGIGIPWNSESSAFCPTIMREDLLGIPLNHVVIKLSVSELNRCLLQGLFFGRQFKIHAASAYVSGINFESPDVDGHLTNQEPEVVPVPGLISYS
jgi:hypothetical protein